MKYPCPKCKSNLEIQKTFNKKIVISCNKCGLQDILDHVRNPDEVYLEFLNRFDKGKLPDKDQIKDGLKQEGIIRHEAEIEAMIGKNKPDSLTKNVLFSKKDYVSHYKTIKKPNPVMGSNVEDVGLGKEISSHLKEIGITRFYKFQEEAIKEIFYGNNVIIEAPTASGKTEAFLIPIIQKIRNENLSGKVSALFVYPTKSLARDQYPKILAFAEKIGINVAVFDGDTKQIERAKVLEDPPHIIVTNFDVLHYHMMYQTKFASLLSSVRFLV
ncbi:MAG: DEAD/DEAH box helicase, partial [Nitrosopumilaceae archaeon]